MLDALLPHGDVTNGATVTVRTLGTSPSAWKLGDDYLFMLSAPTGELSGSIYEVNGAWLGGFPLNAPTAVYIGGEPVSFAAGLTPSEFVERVRDAVDH